MDDFEYVADISGEAGGLAKAMPLFGRMNNSMLSLTDSLLGPDGTDTFDASCNTCLHFERRPMTPLEKSERNVFGMPGPLQIETVPNDRVAAWPVLRV